MFFRKKKAGGIEYLQIVENRREGRKTRQTDIATLRRFDHMQQKSGLETLLSSGAHFSDKLMVLEADRTSCLITKNC